MDKPWGADREDPQQVSPLYVLLRWILAPDNLNRWSRGSKAQQLVLSDDIGLLLLAQGIDWRSRSETWHWMRYLALYIEHVTISLHSNGLPGCMDVYSSDIQVHENVSALCPRFHQRVPSIVVAVSTLWIASKRPGGGSWP